MKVAIVHDWLTGMRGGERCLQAFLDLYPDADIFTLLHVPGSTTPAIANTLDSTLYQTYRAYFDSTPQTPRILTFNLPISTQGLVDLRLHFAELYWGVPGKGEAGIGKRIFDITAEGVTILDNFDITAASGGVASAVVVPIEGIQVNDGVLNLELEAEENFASVSAIEVLRPNS